VSGGLTIVQSRSDLEKYILVVPQMVLIMLLEKEEGWPQKSQSRNEGRGGGEKILTHG